MWFSRHGKSRNLITGPKKSENNKGRNIFIEQLFSHFFSHQFLHHWAWKHYLGPEVVKVIESYFEFYNFEFWDITLQWPFGKKCLGMEPRSKIKTFFSMPSFAWWFLLLKKHDCRNYLQSVLYVHVLHLSGLGEENKRVQTRDGHFRKVRRVAGSEHKAC